MTWESPDPQSQLLARNGRNENGAALGTTPGQDLAADRGGHSGPESVGPESLDSAWLVSSLHGANSLNVSTGSTIPKGMPRPAGKNHCRPH